MPNSHFDDMLLKTFNISKKNLQKKLEELVNIHIDNIT